VKTLVFLLLAASLAFAQTSPFPLTLDTNGTLGVPADNVSSALTSPMLIGDTTAQVANATNIPQWALVTFGAELAQVCSKSGNTLTFGTATVCPSIAGRGLSSTTVAAHNTGVIGYLNVNGYYHRATTAAILNIESKLHTDLVSVRDYGAKGDGVTDDATAINAALATGVSVALPAGTYLTTSAAVLISADNQSLTGPAFGAPAIIVSGSASHPAIKVLNAQNPSISNLSVSSGQDGILVQNTSAVHPVENPLIQNVNVTAFGASSAGVHFNNTACCNYWPTLINVNVNGGTASTRSGYLFDGTAGFNLKPVIVGGWITNVKFGINGGMQSGITNGTEIDAAKTAGAGIAIWLQSGAAYNQFNVRLEACGTGGSNDHDWQMDAGSAFNWITAIGCSGTTAFDIDNGNLNAVFGGDGSGGVVNYNRFPQIFGSVTVDSTYPLVLPGTASDKVQLNGKITGTQLGGVGTMSHCIAANGNYCIATMEDSAGRAQVMVSQGYSPTVNGNTFTNFNSTSLNSTKVVAGTPVIFPYLFTGGVTAGSGVQLSQLPASPPNGSLFYCTNCKNVADDAAVAGAACVTGGSGATAKRQNGRWDCN
jgi:hypothetical protein